MQIVLRSTVLGLILLMGTGCSASRYILNKPVEVERIEEKPKPKPPIQWGVASWYGPGFQGRRTANGERFNTNVLTAAHKTLPFGTMVEVVDVKTQKSVIVRINDRGPFIRGRVIDLSHAAASALNMVHKGTSQIHIRLVEPARG